MSDVERHGHSNGGGHPGEEDYGRLGERRTRRMRIVAWATIASLILIGGGSTVLSLLFG
ncbi:hypothetical protein [Microbacterium sp. AK031]|uniref:hypothetical protein n=1 Tax=Microbacterium sp. AK031 TaxID=2723076 RepID=UPI002168A30A|nr:hypothetical protein [Microbacterium sp. AK031]MCS3844536.1 hypothetical protein [Microbacterium sp. AK031]